MKTSAPLLHNKLLGLLPDSPRWVETRGMLLAGRCLAFGDSTNCVVVDSVMPVLSILGRPAATLLTQALEAAIQPVHVLAPPENQEYVAHLLPGWLCESATLHLLKPSPRSDPVSVENVRLFEPNEGFIACIPDTLAKELRRVADWSLIAATFVEQIPVSFCYASSMTETLWDISIDTLEDYRRRGYAAQCVEYMIRLMNKQGRQPVWGAMNSNAASLLMAQKLAFEPVDQLAVFSK